MMVAPVALLLILFFLLPIALALFAFWIWMLISAVQNKGLTEGEKIAWVLVVALLHSFVVRGVGNGHSLIVNQAGLGFQRLNVPIGRVGKELRIPLAGGDARGAGSNRARRLGAGRVRRVTAAGVPDRRVVRALRAPRSLRPGTVRRRR